MLNYNPPDYFLSAWIDEASAQARFAKAPQRSRADKRASWAWTTITGKAKAKTAIGFYPSNPEKKSRWAAIDFDAHSGEHEQARKRSLEAFSLLLQHPELILSFARPAAASLIHSLANCDLSANGSYFEADLRMGRRANYRWHL